MQRCFRNTSNGWEVISQRHRNRETGKEKKKKHSERKKQIDRHWSTCPSYTTTPTCIIYKPTFQRSFPHSLFNSISLIQTTYNTTEINQALKSLNLETFIQLLKCLIEISSDCSSQWSQIQQAMCPDPAQPDPNPRKPYSNPSNSATKSSGSWPCRRRTRAPSRRFWSSRPLRPCSSSTARLTPPPAETTNTNPTPPPPPSPTAISPSLPTKP